MTLVLPCKSSEAQGSSGSSSTGASSNSGQSNNGQNGNGQSNSYGQSNYGQPGQNSQPNANQPNALGTSNCVPLQTQPNMVNENGQVNDGNNGMGYTQTGNNGMGYPPAVMGYPQTGNNGMGYPPAVMGYPQTGNNSMGYPPAVMGYPQNGNSVSNIQSLNSQYDLMNSNSALYTEGDVPRSLYQSNGVQPCIPPNSIQFPYQNIPLSGRPRIPMPYTNMAPMDTPPEIQQKDPYSLESLRDLYRQIPSSGGRLRRFGSDSFLLGAGNVDELPMDLPVGPDYVLGTGDNLILNMWGGLSTRLSLFIDRQGQIALPEAGTITVNGLTIAAAQAAIQKALGQQFQNEHVEISLGKLRSVRIYVVGDVQRPGAYDVSSLSTPLSALYAAGGPTSRGSLRVLRQYRGAKLVRQIDLYDFLLRGVRADADRMLPGDTILVPPVGPQVTVEGMVHRPAIYELNGEETLSQILELAGGVLVTGNLKQINVERIVANEKHTMLSLNLPENIEAAKKEMAAFRLQGGDDVVISQILPYNQQAVYLEGHVFRPGKYPYRDGMTISDLIHSYQDVMPEPADHAELIRLQPPDYRPITISLNLPDVLMGNDSTKLQPFDLVRIFSRYEMDTPMAKIQGEVLRPGIYPLSQGMRVTDLLRMAGDFKHSAYKAVAGLSSYTIENGQRVLVNHIEVDLQRAIAGDKSADPLLKPGDVVSIDQLAGWIDIGATVDVTGEVIHAGSYGIVPGEHLSSIIKRAGGFQIDAYPQAADLERVQVHNLAEQARQLMITRVESTSTAFNSATLSAAELAAKQQSVEMQKEQVLARLRNNPVSGRLVIDISSDISKWENTPADIEIRPGDTLHIPKLPNFVSINGLVYNTVAISFVPGKTASWYLVKAGGVAAGGDKKSIYVIRADGSVVAHNKTWVSNGVLDIRMRPGDTIIVPEKIVTGSEVWKDIIAAAQAFSTIALAAAAAGVF